MPGDPPVILGEDGLGLAHSPLRFDPIRPAHLAFVSSARYRARAMARHQRVIASAETLGLLGSTRALPAPWRRPFDLARLSLTLHPAGHVPGAAQLHVLTPEGLEICWAGAWRPSEGESVEGGETVACDVLAVDATCARPGLRLPSRRRSMELVRTFVDETHRLGLTPVLLADPLGAAQEVVASLTADKVPLRAHRAVANLAKACRDLGVHCGAPRSLKALPMEGEVIVLPPNVAPEAAGLEGVRVAHVSPLAALRHPEGLLAEVGLPYGDVADQRELLRYAEASGASQVYAWGAGADHLAQALHKRGVEAHVLEAASQLALL